MNEREEFLETIDKAVLAAAHKAVGPARGLRVVEIDRKSGGVRVLAKLQVVEKVQNEHAEIPLPAAQSIKPNAQLGEELEVDATPKDFPQIAAQAAKEAIMRRILEKEKE